MLTSKTNMSFLINFIRKVDKFVIKIAFLSQYLALVTIFANFFLAFSRYVLRTPNMWFFFISTWSMGLLCLLGAAYTLKTGGHIYVDLLYNKVSSQSVRLLLDYLVLMVVMICSAILFYISSSAAWYSTLLGETDETYVLIRPPIWWYKWFLTVSSVLLGLEAFNILLHLREGS